MKKPRRSVVWKARKYCRWIRSYMKRVRDIERELGGRLEVC